MPRCVIVNASSVAKECKRLVIVNSSGVAKEVQRALVVNSSGIAKEFWPPLYIEKQPWDNWGQTLSVINTVTNVSNPPPFHDIRWTTDGLITAGGSPSPNSSNPGNWANLVETTSSNYLIKAVQNSAPGAGSTTGGNMAGASLGTYQAISVDRELTLAHDGGIGNENTNYTWDLDITIARDDPDNPGSPLAGTEVTYNLIMFVQWGSAS